MAESPPSYEAAVGAVTLQGFKDFWPLCLNEADKAKNGVFETFDPLMKRANAWLQTNAAISAFSCETLEKKVYATSDIYGPSLHYPAKGMSCMRIKGLRLWYSRNLSSHPQKLVYVDTLPHKVANPRDPENMSIYPLYDSFQSVIDRFNVELREGRVPSGRIISIQTVTISISKDWWTGVTINPINCAWPDTYKTHKLYFLRVFFEEGPMRTETIGIADFVPEQLESNFFGKPRFTSFQEIVDRAAQWVKKSHGIRITNMQTIDTRYWKLSEIGRRIDTLSSMEYKIQNRPRVTFLRIAFVASSSSSNARNANILFRSFHPMHNCSDIGHGYETLHEATGRVRDWLRATGARLFCIETVYMPTDVHKKHPEEERTVYTGEWWLEHSDSGNTENRCKMMQHIRLYLDSDRMHVHAPSQKKPVSFRGEDEDYMYDIDDPPVVCTIV